MARKFTGTDTSMKFKAAEKDTKENTALHEPSKMAASPEEITGSGQER